MTTYHNGPYTIERGQYGISHGIEWALWGPRKDVMDYFNLLGTYRTLRAAKAAAARHGATGEWTRGRVEVAVVEGKS